VFDLLLLFSSPSYQRKGYCSKYEVLFVCVYTRKVANCVCKNSLRTRHAVCVCTEEKGRDKHTQRHTHKETNTQIEQLFVCVSLCVFVLPKTNTYKESWPFSSVVFRLQHTRCCLSIHKGCCFVFENTECRLCLCLALSLLLPS